MNSATRAPMFDFIVIGGGSGGLASARRAAKLYSKKVLLIEGQRLGGTCVNVGCVPKKIMYNAASLVDSLKFFPSFGITVSSAEEDLMSNGKSVHALKGRVNWSSLKENRDAYIKKLNGIYERNLENDGVKVVRGYGIWLGEGKVQVDNEIYEGKHILIATGSKPNLPMISGMEHGITSDGFFELEHQPKNIAIVGSGYIAAEIANVFLLLGSKVTLFCRQDHILTHFDEMLGRTAQDEMVKAGANIISSSNVLSVEKISHSHIRVNYKQGEEYKNLDGFDCLLFAIGREANIPKTMMKKLELNEYGYINVDEYQNCLHGKKKIDGLYALGDVGGRAMLTPVAIAAGRRLVDRLFGGKQESKIDYSLIPSVVFSHPPIGSIGMSELEARAQFGDEVKVYTCSFNQLFYALSEHKVATKYKLVVLGKDEKIIGLHIIGLGSDEMLQGFAVAIKMGACKKDFDQTMAIHPTASEELVTMV